MNRRTLLTTTAVGAIAATTADSSAARPRRDDRVTTRDGTTLHCEVWGDGEPIVFVHSWALESAMWQYQIAGLAPHGFRCITYDRRGHGRSRRPPHGYDMDTLAEDLGSVLDGFDVTDATLVGHSMGCAEIVRYLTRHRSRRVARIVLLAPTTPCLKQLPDNPDGVPARTFVAVRDLWRADFPKWIVDNTPPFFSKDTSPAMQSWGIAMLQRTSLPVAIACNETLVDADFRGELPAISTPSLVIHGTVDVSAPLAFTGARTAKLLPNARLEVYDGAPHGLFVTHAARVNEDILRFVRQP